MNNLAAKYGAGFTEAPDANFPTGGFKNETTPGLFDGTPYEKGWADDLNAMMQGLIKAAGITVSGSTDTVLVSQILQGMLYQVQTADYFEDSGAADAYILAPLSNNYAPDSYSLGQTFRFIPDVTNTGVSTVNVSSLGVKSIKRADGTALRAGDMTAGDTVFMYYDGTDFLLFYSTADKTKIDEGLTFDEDSSENAGIVTLLSTTTLITSIDFGTVKVGDRIHIDAAVGFTKGGTLGAMSTQLAKKSGDTAVIEFVHDSTTLFQKTPAYGSAVTGNLAMSAILKVTGAGTLELEFSGASAGSDSTVAAGDGELYGYFLRRQ
jgi:hypothetical protein